MARRKKGTFKAKDLNGFNIFHDEEKGTIYYDVFTKNGYVLTNAYARQMSFFMISIGICLIGGILMFGVLNNLLLSVVVPLVVYLGIQIYFHVGFLNKLPCIPDYDKPKRDFFLLALAKLYSYTVLWIFVVLGYVTASLILASCNYQQLTGFDRGTYLFGAGFTFLFSFLFTLVLIYKKVKKVETYQR